jgi:uncharacterized protein (DUF2236 family)
MRSRGRGHAGRGGHTARTSVLSRRPRARAAGSPDSRGDAGYFGPGSVSWRVHREAAVMLGGARALLMHAAHPLVVAGARQTQMYTRDPWARLERTLRLNYMVTFGSKAQADATARHVNAVHAAIHGIDSVTGRPYDALDHDLLLWVHACLVDTALLMERLVVGDLDPPGRQRFYEESLVQAELLALPRSAVPPTFEELGDYMRGVISSGVLRRTDGSEAVGALIRHPPPETPSRRVWRLISFWSFGLLPEEIRRDVYSVDWNQAQEFALRASLRAARYLRPLAPGNLRFIPPARTAARRAAGEGHEELPESLLPGRFQMPPDAQENV